MKLERVDIKEEIPLKKLFEVSEIKLEDINPPSADFLNFIKTHKEYSFLNYFTMDKFRQKMMENFTCEVK
jgi:hypothetical protein